VPIYDAISGHVTFLDENIVSDPKQRVLRNSVVGPEVKLISLKLES
jgi:hypothetical protein